MQRSSKLCEAGKKSTCTRPATMRSTSTPVGMLSHQKNRTWQAKTLSDQAIDPSKGGHHGTSASSWRKAQVALLIITAAVSGRIGGAGGLRKSRRTPKGKRY